MTLDLDQIERINNAGDRYGHITPGVVAELCAEVRRLREALNTPQLTRCELGSGGWSADGAHHDAAETAFMSYHASVVTVYYGTKRVFAHMAEFDSVHPKVKP